MKDDIITLNKGTKKLMQGVTLKNVPLNHYMEFLAVSQDWGKIVTEIAECCEIGLYRINDAKWKVKEYREKVMDAKGGQVTDAEQKEYQALLQNYAIAKKYPEMVIDGNKVIKLCMKYAHLGMSEEARKYYGWGEGLPDTTKVRIE